MGNKEFTAAMELIIKALREKEHDPYVQLAGYIKENDPRYITRHNDAREMIQSLDMDQIKRYVEEMRT